MKLPDTLHRCSALRIDEHYVILRPHSVTNPSRFYEIATTKSWLALVSYLYLEDRTTPPEQPELDSHGYYDTYHQALDARDLLNTMHHPRTTK